MEDHNKRTPLTLDEAAAMLPEGDTVHVFSNPSASLLIGADWSREEVMALLAKGAELAGPAATNMGHGIACLEGGRWFVETKRK